MAFHDELVDVAALVGVHGIEAEVVEDQEVDGEERPQLLFVGPSQPGLPQGLKQLVDRPGEDRVAAAAGDVAEGVRQEGPPDADRADNGDVVVDLEKPQRGELGPQTAELIGRLLGERPLDRLRSALAILRLAHKYAPRRVEAACIRALAFDQLGYGCASTPKFPHLMNRQSPAPTGGRSSGRQGRGAPPGWG